MDSIVSTEALGNAIVSRLSREFRADTDIATMRLTAHLAHRVSHHVSPTSAATVNLLISAAFADLANDARSTAIRHVRELCEFAHARK